MTTTMPNQTTKPIERIIIGYGSESGNAKALAHHIATMSMIQNYQFCIMALNDIDINQLTKQDRLLVIASSFGDGEPPVNADYFLTQVMQANLLCDVHYAIFGLGDTAYTHFCGFTKALDRALKTQQAISFINRVDADLNYRHFVTPWCRTLEKVLGGDLQAGFQLELQVKAYAENNTFPAQVIERQKLNHGTLGAYHLRLNIEGSNIHYQAGDLLYLIPENDIALLIDIANWLNDPLAVEKLRHKELRHLSKSVLRELAKQARSDGLKSLLKINQRKQLDEYLIGCDLLDVLTDFCAPDSISLTQLETLLSSSLPRTYSIASDYHPDYVDLCIREVTYTKKDRLRHGSATRALLTQSHPVQIFCRANPRFYLPHDEDVPFIFIATGVGIAPFMGLLEQLERLSKPRTLWFLLGEKQAKSDFLYQTRLQSLHEKGIITHLLPVFSRDQDRKYYVQDALLDYAIKISQLLQQGAHIYLCGNKATLNGVLEQTLAQIMATQLQFNDEQVKAKLSELNNEKRLHIELY